MTGKVFLLDDDPELRGAFADLFRLTFHLEVLSAESLAEMMELRTEVLECRLAILDINLGAGCPSGLDAYRWLRDRNYAGKIVFLTGHAGSTPLVAEARRIGQTEVREKPLTLRELREVVASVDP